MRCEVCDQTRGEILVIRGLPMHRECAPSHWVKDDRHRFDFMARVDAWWETPAADKWKKPRRGKPE